ncbi:MAG: 50S ribosomal protein L21 [Minisyncoccota bacterium]
MRKSSAKPAEKASGFAVIKTGGKQYKVTPGQILKIEKLSGEDLKAGDTVSFDQVLLVVSGDNVSVGTPTVDGTTVTAEYVRGGKAKKITVIKYKQKSRYFKKRGHRQPFAEVKISAIK